MNQYRQSHTSTFAFLAGATLALSTAAQASPLDDPSDFRGLAAAWPAGMILSADGPILVKGPNDQNADNGTLTPPSAPQPPSPGHALDNIYALYNIQHDEIEVDAISSGNGVIPFPDNNGVPGINGDWLALTASVADGEVGISGPNVWRAADSSTDLSAGSEMVSYYFQASTGITDSLIGTTAVEMSRSNIGLTDGATPDVSAWDFGIGVFDSNSSLSGSVFFANSDRLLFSVSAEWANAPTRNGSFATDFATKTQDIPAHGADIYYMKWEGAVDGWKGPYLWASHADLGFNTLSGASADDLDLDALDLQWVNGNSQVVYSGTNASRLPSQLMIAAFVFNDDGWVSTINHKLMELAPGSSGPNVLSERPDPVASPLWVVPVTQRLGLRTSFPSPVTTPDDDEVDAACTIDPEAGEYGRYVGTATARNLSLGTPMGMSMVRVEQPPSQPSSGGSPGAQAYGTRYVVNVNGWGDATPQLGIVQLYRREGAIDADDVFPTTGWYPAGTATRFNFQPAVKINLTHLPTWPNTTGIDEYTVMAEQLDRIGNVIASTWCTVYVKP